MKNLSRRSFLRGTIGVAGALTLSGSCRAQETRETQQVLANHVGFTPGAAKVCLFPAAGPRGFRVLAADGAVLLDGETRLVKGDLGEYRVGDFSDVTHGGEVRVEAEGLRPAGVRISEDVYDDALGKTLEYFATQRCGDSTSGYNAPCHLDDGVRDDNGRRHDVSGGWHDACDVRKWVSATIYGMIGLSRTLDALGPERIDRERVIDEQRWGNTYFRKMQEPEGYVMSWCGGDEGNNFTDNVRGTNDDRHIRTEAAELPEQFHFVSAQAGLARQVREADPDYARGCLEAAKRCFDWCMSRRNARSAASVSAGASAAVQMHRATGAKRWEAAAAEMLQRLTRLQARGEGDEPRGFFFTKPHEPEPYRDIMHGNLPLLALCDALEHFADHADHAAWRETLQMHVEHLAAMAGRSAFETMPFGLYSGSDPGGGRRAGDYWYRWFMKPGGETPADDWWVGINAHLASNGVGLHRAGVLLNNARLKRLAQRQLDWILGVNPFNASTMSGVGRNQPRLYVTGQFAPPTPTIAGGVMNGIGGDERDKPWLKAGSWQTCEYWTPMVAYTMWLMASLAVQGAQ